jgi:hypothetical protein
MSPQVGRISPGGDVELLDVSPTRALVEGKTRLPVTTFVSLETVGPGAQRLTGRIARCQVVAVHRDGTFTYRMEVEVLEAARLENAGMGGSSSGAPDASTDPVNQW